MLYSELRIITVESLDEDAALMLRVREGDVECFDLLVARHRDRLVKRLWRMVRDRDSAEDLAQEAFLRVFRAKDRYEPSAKFVTWLTHIATNLALNHIRKQRPEYGKESIDAAPRYLAQRYCTDPCALPEDALGLKQVRSLLRTEVLSAMDALPDRQRQAVHLHCYSGVDYTGVASELGCSMQAVKALLSRAYSTLRRELSKRDTGRLLAA